VARFFRAPDDTTAHDAKANAQPRSDLVRRARPFVPPDSEIRQAFIAQSARGFWIIMLAYLTGLTICWIRYRCVVVTDEAIYVLDARKWSGGSRPRALIATLPRHTRLGPVSGRWASVDLAGERHWVHKRFHQQIRAADRHAGFGP